jgi:hypothetical protein
MEKYSPNITMLQDINMVNKPHEKALAVEKCVGELQIFKEPVSQVVTPKIKTKKVLDEDSYVQVMRLC